MQDRDIRMGGLTNFEKGINTVIDSVRIVKAVITEHLRPNRKVTFVLYNPKTREITTEPHDVRIG
jgi:hypothetical protein